MMFIGKVIYTSFRNDSDSHELSKKSAVINRNLSENIKMKYQTPVDKANILNFKFLIKSIHLLYSYLLIKMVSRYLVCKDESQRKSFSVLS